MAFRAWGGEKANGAEEEEGSPAPLLIGGGVVTGAVTTPPGSLAALGLCSLRVAAQVRVYARHREHYRILCATHARDLRGRADLGKAASITQRIRPMRRSLT